MWLPTACVNFGVHRLLGGEDLYCTWPKFCTRNFCLWVRLFFNCVTDENILQSRCFVGPICQFSNMSMRSMQNAECLPYHSWHHFQVKKIVEAILQSSLSCAMEIACWLPTILLWKEKNVLDPAWIGPFQANLPSLIRVRIAKEKSFLGAMFCSTPAHLLHSAINRALLVSAASQNWCVKTDHGVSKHFSTYCPNCLRSSDQIM